MPIHIPEIPERPEPGPDRPDGAPGPAASPTAAPRLPPSRVRDLPSERWYGVYPALVADNRDPEGLGRVRIVLPWTPEAGGASGMSKGEGYSAWARLATMAAGHDRGSWFLPDVNDEVLVSFEAGHPGRPIVVGALWNGQDRPPITADPQNSVKVLRTRSGAEVRFTDVPGEESVEIRTGSGQAIVITAAKGGAIQIADHSNRVTLDATGVTVQAAATVQVSGATVRIAAGMIELQAPMVKCDGVIQGGTLIADSVVASSYTPGAGNIW